MSHSLAAKIRMSSRRFSLSIWSELPRRVEGSRLVDRAYGFESLGFRVLGFRA